jgi:(p)ppGpp synthase/HD superfamily hydrolase
MEFVSGHESYSCIHSIQQLGWTQGVSMAIHPIPGDLWHALSVAVEVHCGHRRKVTGSPYLVHPVGVLHILLRYGFEESPFGIAAILHDTVEHRLLTEEEVERDFGPAVASLVMGLTPRGERQPWRRRKAADVERLRWADDELIILACADKLDNLLAVAADAAILGEEAWKRLKRSREDVEWQYRSLATMFAERAAEHPKPRILLDFVAKVEEVFGKEVRD